MIFEAAIKVLALPLLMAGSSGPVLSLSFLTQTTLDSRITFSRPSLATMFDSTGKLTYCPNNLLTNNIDPNLWGKSGVASVVGQLVTLTGAGGFQNISNSGWGGTAVIGQQFIFGVTLSGSGTITLDVNGATGSSTVTLTAVPTYYTLKVTAVAASSLAARIISYGGNTATSFTMYNAFFSAVTYETTTRAFDFVNTASSAYYGHRIDYNPATLAVRGLLIEESRTNLFLNAKADGITALATQSVTLTAVAHTLSFYGTGTVTLTGASVAGPAVGAGAFPTRTTLTFTPTAGSVTFTVLGDVFYAQLEVGAFATSFVPTSASAVTRSADSASIAGASFSSWYRQSQGTFVIGGAVKYNGGGNPAIIAINNNTLNESMYVFFPGAIAGFYILDGGVTTAALLFGSITANTEFKIGAAYRLDDTNLAVAGAVTTADASCTMPAPTQLQVGINAGSNVFNGWLKTLDYYNTRKSNADLQALTT